MTMKLALAARNAYLDDIAARINGGSGPGILQIYTGTPPATGAAITSQVLLGTLTFNDPCAAASNNGVLTMNAIAQDSSADATGIATWARASTTNTGAATTPVTHVADFTVGTSGTDIVLTSASITAGGPISVSTFTITAGNP